jgi:hypothetical protein
MQSIKLFVDFCFRAAISYQLSAISRKTLAIAGINADLAGLTMWLPAFLVEMASLACDMSPASAASGMALCK